MAVGDAASGGLACVLAFAGWAQFSHANGISTAAVGGFGLAWPLSLLLVHGYSALTPRSRLYSAVSVAKATVPLTIFALTWFFLQPYVINRPSILFSVGTGAIFVAGFRLSLARSLLHPIFATPTLLLTSVKTDPDVTQALDAARFEWRILQVISVGQGADDLRERLSQAIGRHRPPEILVGAVSTEDLELIIDCALQAGVLVRKLSTVLEQYLNRVPLDHVSATWLLDLPNPKLGDRPFLAAKRFLDLLLASVLAVPLLVVTPIVAAAIRLDSRGPVYVRQSRCGQLGHQFTLIKFRTMRVDAEAFGVQWSVSADPRITRVGRFLRSSRLDELPQILNIWRGEMSFIGPRPERPEFVALLETQLSHYRARLLVKPGLTGWAQVNSGYAASVSDSARKLEYDLYYVKYRGLRLDLQVLALTVFVVLGLRGR